MAKLTVKAQATANRIEHVFIQDSTSTTGAGKTALTNASVTAYYIRPGEDPTSITLNAGTLKTFPTTNTDTQGTFVKVDDTNMPGLYEVCLPNNVFKTGANHAIVMIKGTGIAPVLLEYDLVAYDPLVSTNLGLSALPTANPATSGGLITNGTGTGQISLSSGAVTVGTNNDKTGYTLTQSFPSNFSSLAITAGGAVTAGTVSDKTGYSLSSSQTFNLTGNITGDLSGSVGSVTGNVGGNVVGSVASVTGAVGSVAGNVAGSVNSVVTAVTVGAINTDAITASSIQADAITAAKIASDVSTEIGTGVWASTTRTLSTGGNTAIVDAVWKANVATDSTATAWPNSTFGNRVLRSSINTNATEGIIWDVDLRDHVTTHSTGKALDQVRKSNFVTDGAIDGTSTSTVLNTGLTGYPTGAFDHQTLLFIDGALMGESSPILSYNTDGTITMSEAFTSAPTSGSNFVILATHVYPLSDIVSGILAGVTSTSTYSAGEVGNVLARLNAMTQSNGSGDWQFDSVALALAPTGGGGGGTDWTANERTAIRAILGVASDNATPISPTSGALYTINTSVGNVETDTQDIQGRLPATLVSGKIDASVGAYQTNMAPLQPTTAGRTLDVTATGAAGIDWANIENPTTAQNFSGTTISTTQQVASVTNPVAVSDKTGFSLASSQTFSTSGSVGSVTGSVQSVTNAVAVSDKTGFSLASSQTFSTTGSVGSVTGSVQSVTNGVTVSDKTGFSLASSQTFSTTGSVGSVTGDVNGDVIGSVGSVDTTVAIGSINNGVITADTIAANAITSAKIDTTATTAISNSVWDMVRGASRPSNSFGAYLDASVSGVGTSVGSVATTLATVASDVTTIKGNTDGVESVTNKLDTTLQVISGTPNYRFTASALSLAPTGGAGSIQYVPVTLPLGTNTRQTLTFNEGASLPLREDILQEQDRTPLDLSTADSVVYELMAVDATSPKVYASATVVDGVAGRVRYTWQAGDLDEVGTYRERWVVTFPTGQVSIFGPLVKVV